MCHLNSFENVYRIFKNRCASIVYKKVFGFVLHFLLWRSKNGRQPLVRIVDIAPLILRCVHCCIMENQCINENLNVVVRSVEQRGQMLCKIGTKVTSLESFTRGREMQLRKLESVGQPYGSFSRLL